jgi:hypothetical protein
LLKEIAMPDDTTTKVQGLLDQQALRELNTRYCRAIDRRDYVLLKTLYHADAKEDRGAIFAGTAADFVSWVQGDAVNYELTVHRLFNMLFVVEGDRAQGEIYAEAYHRTVGENPAEVVAGGRYLDHYEKRQGRWGIVSRSATVDRCEMRPLDPEAYRQFVAGSMAGVGGADDPSYRVLALLGSGQASG